MSEGGSYCPSLSGLPALNGSQIESASVAPVVTFDGGARGRAEAKKTDTPHLTMARYYTQVVC